MMKGQTALFNQKTSKMLVYEQIKQENAKTKKLFYVTNFNIYHLDKSERENYREFYSTEKFVGVPSYLSPKALKIRMMDLLIDFMPNYAIENYFRWWAYLLFFTISQMYMSSTFCLAQGVFRKNFKLDFILGLSKKQLIRILYPNSSHPKVSYNSVTILSRVFPCNGSFDILK